MRAKEFLSRRNIDHIVVDVLNDPGGREQLLKLGVRNVPVVAKGASYVFGQNLEDVAEFIGLAGTGHKLLPPGELIQKWVGVLRAVQRYLRQMPAGRINERVIENRDRSIRILSHHTFRIGEAFLESAIDGVEYAIGHANVPPKDGTFLTGAEIAGYGEEVIRRLQQWWDGLPD
ncbi:MAG: glutaredoxin, partial [Betaproteobacteria bacterium]|nr:glutaredoxin [Betaproteobacteria bacterium]